ncbi:MAG: type II toxin-antitoxin system HicB family antitoxin [Phycisphaerales bacterium]
MKRTSTKYVVVIEQAADGSYSAYVPDLPGCVSCGETPEGAEQLIREAIGLHLESLRQHGEPVPQPTTKTITIQAA